MKANQRLSKEEYQKLSNIRRVDIYRAVETASPKLFEFLTATLLR